MKEQLKELISESRWGYGDMGKVLEMMIGQTVLGVKVDTEDDKIRFQFKDCDVVFYHSQDCCESVVIDDINGDFQGMVGDTLLVADERVNESTDEEEYHESSTWTFYTFRSNKTSVDVKWHGSSNGYYSESVNVRVESPTYEG